MFYSFLISLREGLEAALIVGIMLAYLVKMGRTRERTGVWTGVVGALVISLAGGLLLHEVIGTLSGAAMEIFEGGMMLAATLLLTWMIMWMQRQSRKLKAAIQGQMDNALGSGSTFAMAGVAFTVVIREGLETVLFLGAGAASADSVLTYILGGVAGGLLATVLGYLVYKGGLRLDLRRFFTVTGWLLIVFAAGMVANGLKELHEAGIVPRVVGHVWDTYAILPDNSQTGRMLGALLGYDASPSLVQVLGYVAYLGLTGLVFWKGTRLTKTPPTRAA